MFTAVSSIITHLGVAGIEKKMYLHDPLLIRAARQFPAASSPPFSRGLRC